MDFPLLNRLEQMQSRPFGTNTALSDGNERGVGGSAGSQIRKQESAYGRALRILDRQARRGDANSALRAIGVREQANAQGFSPGGIRNKAEADAGILGRINAMEQGAADRAQAEQLTRQQIAGQLGGTGQVAADVSAANPDAGVTPQAMDAGANFTGPPETKNYAALDILEGNPLTQGGPNASYSRGFNSAKSLGVADPNSVLQGNTQLKYRQTLDQALGAAKSPQEIDSLRERGSRFGVPIEAFNRRAKWWETNRI